MAIGRKNWLFAGSDAGGEILANAMTLIETAKLSGLNPEAYLADLLARINDHLITRLDELLPWNWKTQHRTPSRSRVNMAAITRVFTIARVAEILADNEDRLHDISIEMEPEDGILRVYGTDDACSPAFTDFGIENLRELLEIRRENAEHQTAKSITKSPTGP